MTSLPTIKIPTRSIDYSLLVVNKFNCVYEERDVFLFKQNGRSFEANSFNESLIAHQVSKWAAHNLLKYDFQNSIAEYLCTNMHRFGFFQMVQCTKMLVH